MFLSPHKCLVACDSKGLVMFFTFGSTNLKEKLLLQKYYTTNSLTNKKFDAPVQSLGFY
jgi:hypothetical protein